MVTRPLLSALYHLIPSFSCKLLHPPVLQLCAVGYYRRSAHFLVTECTSCADILGVTCPSNSTIETLSVNEGYWRLASTSLETSQCERYPSGLSPCRGGADAGDDGSGYCVSGFTGPRCELCVNSSQYVSDDGICTTCPSVHARIGLVLGISVGAALFIIMIGAAMLRFSPRASTIVSRQIDYLLARVSAHALLPKVKLVIAFCQTAGVVPTVYNLRLPSYYFDWLRFLNVFEVNWLNNIYPRACVTGGFETWLLVRALVPLGVVAVFVMGSLMSGIALHLYHNKTGRLPWRNSLLDSLPLLLFFAFCLTPSTSTSIFAAWSCEEFQLDSTAAPPTTVQYLLGDLSVTCDTSTSDEYSRIVRLASGLVALCECCLTHSFGERVMGSAH